MCGIVGVVGDIFQNDKKMFDFMLKLDTIRGHHSTGVAYIRNHNRKEPILVKNVGTPWDLINDKPEEYYNSKNKGDIQGDFCAMIGHNRWATVGEINERNAHPFHTGSIVGAQNGTFSKYWHEKLDDYKDYGTDSEALFHNIDLYGVNKVIPSLMGAYALAWYDIENDTFNLLRNKDRPLYMAWKKNGKVMYFASQAEFIYMAAERFGVDLQGDTCYIVSTDTHYAYRIGNVNTFGEDRETSEEVKEYEPKVSTTWRPHTVVSSAQSSANVFKEAGTNTSQNFSIVSGNELSVKEWSGKVGQYKEFQIVDGTYTDEQRKVFYLGKMMQGGACVRIYPSSTRDVKKILETKDASTFTAKVKRIKTNGKNFYILVDTDTLMVATFNSAHYREVLDDDIPFEEKNEQQRFDNLFTGSQVMTIANGEVVDPHEYERRVSKGCCWCSAVPSLADAAHVHWINKDDFLCADCSSNQDVMQYVQQMA